MDDKQKNMVRTSALLNRIFKASGLNGFLSENESVLTTQSLSEYLELLCSRKNVIREHVIKRSGIERSFGHQIFRGSRSVSRDNAIRLAYGFELSVEETQELLKAARKAPLYPKIKRDAVILYGLSHHMTILETQALLNEQNIMLLGGEQLE
jgi:cyanate lyase